MKVSRERLLNEAAATGFRREILEKVVQLFALLNRLKSHPFLKDKLALRGGTALNLFYFDTPRLSVDIDLNFVGTVEKDTFLRERPMVDKAVRTVCEREGFTVQRVPEAYAGGKWLLRYQSALGQGGNLELDLNFMYRVPLWPVQASNSQTIGSYRTDQVTLLDIHEIFAGKLAALFSRSASRDFFDISLLKAKLPYLDQQRLRLAFVVYGAMNRKDWRTLSIDKLSLEDHDVENLLFPLLRTDSITGMGSSKKVADQLLSDCRQVVAALLPLRSSELEFLNKISDEGEIMPSLITDDREMAQKICDHPGLNWKAINVQNFKAQQ